MTGALSGGIHRVEVSKMHQSVRPTVPYALIHEVGGPIKRGGEVVGKMPERPHLRPAIDDWVPIAEK
ncbi:MAG: hypothetical protein ACPGPE_04985, partial [Planctomycetota bacterium]